MASVPVTLIFSDGVSHRLNLEPGSNVVKEAANEGLNLLTDCSNGQCGTCAARLCSGAIDLADYDPAVLPNEDRDDGGILPCVSRVTGPCVIEFPYESTEATAEQPDPVRGTVIAIDQIATETVRLEVQVPASIVFEPGQYVRMRPPGTDAWRSYSMASPSGSTRLVFYIRVVAGGSFSGWLSGAAKPGAELEVSAPHGAFFLRDEPRNRLFIAGGTGLAPFLAMLDAIQGSEALKAQRTTLLMGARTPGHFFAKEELDRYSAAIPGLEVRFAAETDAGGGCHAGFATDLIKELKLDATTRVYLCGPPPMVDAGRNAAVAAGVVRNDVLCERFT